MAAGEFTPATVRRVFFDRDGERCFMCRKPLRFEERGHGWSMHHRKPRGAGGTKRTAAAAVASPANALTLCGSGTTGCHGWVEHNRARAIESGLLISLHGVGPDFYPESVRVQRNDGSWWILTRDGRAVEVEGGTR